MSDKNVVHVFGYDFQPTGMPVLRLQNASGQMLRTARVTPAYVTHYQVDLDFSAEDFDKVLPGDRVVLDWPDQADPNTISLTLNPPAQVRIETATFTPTTPVATNGLVALTVKVRNVGGTRSRDFTATWIPDPLDPRFPLPVAHEALNPGETAEVSLGSYTYLRSGLITSAVTLGNGYDTKLYPVLVAAPPAEPLPDRDLPGFPRTVTVSGKIIGGFGATYEYGGACSPGYVRSTADVRQLEIQGRAVAELQGWKDPGNPQDCRVVVHFSITPNIPVNWVKTQISIRERGQ